MNLVPQRRAVRPPKFMPMLLQKTDSRSCFVNQSRAAKAADPIQYGHAAILLSIENDDGARHTHHASQNCEACQEKSRVAGIFGGSFTNPHSPLFFCSCRRAIS